MSRRGHDQSRHLGARGRRTRRFGLTARRAAVLLLACAALLAGPAPAQDADAAYRIDAADILDIAVPGYPEFTGSYIVGQDGTILMNLIGVVPVAGLTAGALEQRLIDQLSVYLRRPEGLRVRVAQKRMLIRVLGYVRQPGQLVLPKGTNVQEALGAVGGVLPGAIVTRIVIRREQGDLIEEIPVDLKSYVEGTGTLPELQGGDEIFVRRVETTADVERPLTSAEIYGQRTVETAMVLGAVRQPGPVLLADDTDLFSVLMQAGGPLPGANLQRVVRIPGGRGAAETFDLQRYLEQGGVPPPVYPGDVIRVPSQIEPDLRVSVRGAVVQPGLVLLPEGADLQLALQAAGGLLPTADTRSIRLLRSVEGVEAQRIVDLEAWLRSGDPALLPDLVSGDVLVVPKGPAVVEEPYPTVLVQGHVAQPGAYPLMASRPLVQALLQARPLPTADLEQVRIVRPEAEDAPVVQVFNLEAYQAGAVVEPPDLQAGDIVVIEPNQVSVVGAVVNPGIQQLLTDATVIDALAAAGGPTLQGDLHTVVITRQTEAGPARQVLDLTQYLYNPEEAPPLPEVRAGDTIAVEQLRAEQRVAYVLGAVRQPGPVALPDQEASLLYAVTQTGGLTPTADRKRIRIIRAVDAGAADVPVAIEWYDMHSLETGLAPETPPLLHPGDIVFVDEFIRPGRGVLVLGAVNRQGWVPIEADGQTVMETLGYAGGMNGAADAGNVALVRGGSGEVLHLDLGDFVRTGEPQPIVEEGDTLVVGQREVGAPGLFDQILRYLPFVNLFIR